MMDANNDIFELMELFDQVVLFTNARIDRKTVPDFLYAYDLRDECDGIPCTIEKYVSVNHFGTIIASKPIELNSLGYGLIREDDYGFIGDEMTLAEFVEYIKKLEASEDAGTD